MKNTNRYEITARDLAEMFVLTAFCAAQIAIGLNIVEPMYGQLMSHAYIGGSVVVSYMANYLLAVLRDRRLEKQRRLNLRIQQLLRA